MGYFIYAALVDVKFGNCQVMGKFIPTDGRYSGHNANNNNKINYQK
jgi:hypothetical protein